jgi:glutathione S-transferase
MTYAADNGWIVGRNGTRFNNRPLYGDHRPSYVLAGDRPQVRFARAPNVYGCMTAAVRRGDAARWLFFEARHLSEPIGELWFNGWLRQKRGKVPDTMAMSRAEKVSARYLAVLEAHVAERDWMLGENFSLVDCCYGPVLDAYALAGSYIDAYPAIKAYLGRMRARPSWKRCAFMS